MTTLFGSFGVGLRCQIGFSQNKNPIEPSNPNIFFEYKMRPQKNPIKHLSNLNLCPNVSNTNLMLKVPPECF